MENKISRNLLLNDENILKMYKFGSNMGHIGFVSALVMTSDDQYVISGALDMTIRIWKIGKEEPVQIISECSQAIQSISIADGGRYLVAGVSDGNVILWENKKIRSDKGKKEDIYYERIWGINLGIRVYDVDVSANAEYIIAGDDDGFITVFKKIEGIENEDNEAKDKDTKNKDIKDKDTNKKKKIEKLDNNLNVEKIDYKIIAKLKHGDKISSIAITKNGEYILSTSTDNAIMIWRRSSKEEVPYYVYKNIIGPSNINSIAITDDMSYIFCGSEFKVATLWKKNNQGDYDVILSIKHNLPVNSVGISEDGKYLLSADSSSLTVWVREDNKEDNKENNYKPNAIRESCQIFSASINSNGNYIMVGCADGKVNIWKREDRHPDLYQLINSYGIEEFNTRIVITEDEEYVITGTSKGNVVVYKKDEDDYKKIQEMGHKSWVNSISISADKRYLATGSTDGVVKIWSKSTKKGKEVEIYKLIDEYDTKGFIMSGAISSDGKYVVSGASNGIIRVWKREKEKEKIIYKELDSFKHEGSVNYIIFDKNENFLITGSDDGAIKFWKIEKEKDSFKQILALKHKDGVHAVAISDDLEYVIGATSKALRGKSKGSIYIWKRQAKDEFKYKVIQVMDCESGIHDIALDSTNKFIISATEDKIIRIWEIGKKKPKKELRGHFARAKYVKIINDKIMSCDYNGLVIVWKFK